MHIFQQILCFINFLGTFKCNENNQCYTTEKLHKVRQTNLQQNYELTLNLSTINTNIHQLYTDLEAFKCLKMSGPFSDIYKCNSSRKICNQSFKLRDMTMEFVNNNKLVIIPLEILIIENQFYSLVQQNLEHYNI